MIPADQTLHPAPLPTESDAESAADPEIGKKADAAEAPVEEEMKDATDNPAEEEEEEDNEDDEGEVFALPLTVRFRCNFLTNTLQLRRGKNP